MKKILFTVYFLLCGIILITAQTLNSSETAKLKSFLDQESAESGKKNYQQLGIQNLETVDWKNVTGLVWNSNDLLDSLRWVRLRLGGDLDLSGFTEVRYIQCTHNEYFINGLFIDGLRSIDVTGCTSLLYFDCYNNSFTSLDISTNINLEFLCCRWQNNALKELDLTHNPKLWHFCGTGNQFEYIDISKNPELIDFFCAVTNLKAIDVSKNLKLKEVYLRGNQLTELDFSNHPALEYLTCYDNQLTKLNVSGCPNLKTLEAHNNQLKEIKIDYLDMNKFTCQNNYLTFSTFPRLKSPESMQYAPQKTVKLSVPSNIVDLSSEYTINGVKSIFRWTNYISPIDNDGVFTLNTSLQNILCYVTNASYPGIMLTYDIELFSAQSADLLQDIGVYAVGNQLVLKTDRPLTAEIYTATGALVKQLNINDGEYMIPMPKGVYIVKLNNGMIQKLFLY